MCGGKKEPDKKIQGPPMPETPEAETPAPVAEETTPPPPPPVEEPKGSASAAKSEFGTDSQMAANAKSIALMSTRQGHGAGYAKKGPVAAVGSQSIAGGKNVSLALTTFRPEVTATDNKNRAFVKSEIPVN